GNGGSSNSASRDGSIFSTGTDTFKPDNQPAAASSGQQTASTNDTSYYNYNDYANYNDYSNSSTNYADNSSYDYASNYDYGSYGGGGYGYGPVVLDLAGK